MTAADAGCLAAAGRQLGMSASAVTRAVAALERQLGSRLLHRSARGTHPAGVGAHHLEHCRRILAALAEANRSASGQYGSPRGSLTLAVPESLGAMFMTPIVAAYLDL